MSKVGVNFMQLVMLLSSEKRDNKALCQRCPPQRLLEEYSLSSPQNRFQRFEQWSRQQALQLGVSAAVQFTTVSGDASFRSYYRISDGVQSFIAVNSPPDKEKNDEFVALSQLLITVGVNAPVVKRFDRDNGFMLLTDLGDNLLLPALNTMSVDDLYAKAVDALLAIQTAPIDTLQPYDADKLRDEMLLFNDWFVQQMLGYELSSEDTELLDKLYRQLVTGALSQPQVFVHRDYHARNLMLLSDGNIGVIDFQDGVAGPITYDLVSLYKDCYVRWPRSQVVAWVESFRQQANDSVDEAIFLQQFDWMGLQRHLKVLGIFARLFLRDGKDGYLADLPRVLAYVREVCGLYPEFAEFQHWFEQKLQPLVEQQAWYQGKGIN